MAAHVKELSEDLRIRIVALHKDYLVYKKFCNSLELNYSTVARVIQRCVLNFVASYFDNNGYMCNERESRTLRSKCSFINKQDEVSQAKFSNR